MNQEVQIIGERVSNLIPQLGTLISQFNLTEI
jgi:hypothetical protein